MGENSSGAYLNTKVSSLGAPLHGWQINKRFIFLYEPPKKYASPDSGKKEIIFFDELNVGWFVDKNVIGYVKDCNPSQDPIIEKTLADLLR